MAKAKRPRYVALIHRVRQMYPDIDDPVTLIESNQIIVNGVIVTNPAALVRADAAVKRRHTTPPRGRLKLEAALTAFQVPVRDRIAADIGASTGGFTLALLEAGAQRVYSIDAGHGQLLGSLRSDARVVNLERVNLGILSKRLVPETVDVITVDLSYLPLAVAAPQLEVLDIADDADLVALVKPMYELGLSAPPRDNPTRQRAVDEAIVAFGRHRWRWLGTVESPIRGRNGATEYLTHFCRDL
jgi:23S rRNA (cytidine1920-2'-O)/16S rRNA (cytidine1409-2'-O)-methyltransferase